MPPISLTRVRLSTLLFPPFGLVLLWRSSQIGLGRKIFGTFGIALYSLPYAALIIFLLYRFCGLQIELRGGYVPRLTYHKTLPDYAAVEASRAQQKQSTQERAAKAVAGTNAYWTGFRGPNRDGRYNEQPLQTAWPREGLRAFWRQPIGGGYASFAVADGRAFTIEQRREQEVVTAYDMETGHELWAHGWLAEFQEPLGGDGPRATPAYDEGRVYALGALGELRCVAADTGKQLWRRNVVDENQAPNLVYGVSASPLIVDEKVIVMSGGPNGKSVAAYHKVTGEPIWKSFDDEAAYSSPMLVNLAGQRQLLVVSKKRALGIDLAQGKLLWEFPWVVLQ